MDRELKQKISTAYEELRGDIVGTGETIWRTPETGYREFNTSELLAQKLAGLGLPVRTGLALTGLRADLDTGRPGPTVAVIGEMDALLQPHHPESDPKTGAAHSCGHHTHAASMYGAAAVLSRPEIRSELSGRVAFIAAPAEEGIELGYRRELLRSGKIRALAGKASLIAEGVFDDVDLAFMNHVGMGYTTTDCNGYLFKFIRFKGIAVHACNTHRGRNPLNALDLARHAIALMREAADSADHTTRIHGIVTASGNAINTVPGETAMEYMIRAGRVESLHRLSKEFDRAVGHAALACGCGVEIDTFPGSMPLVNSPVLAEIYRKEIAGLGFDMIFNAPGQWDYGSTDMGDVSQIVPAIHMNVPGCNGHGHQDDFAIIDPEAAYLRNSELLVLVTAELLAENAEAARRVIAAARPPMSREEYKKLTASFATKLDEPLPKD